MEHPKEDELILGGFFLPDKSVSKKLEGIGEETFSKLGETLGNWTKEFFSSYKDKVTDHNLPNEVTLEFGIKLSMEGNMVRIIKAGAEADLKLKMSWKDLQT